MLQLLVVEFYEENEDWVEHRLVDLSDGIELERDPKTRERKHDLFVNLNRHFGEGRRDFAEKRRALAQRSRNAGGRRH